LTDITSKIRETNDALRKAIPCPPLPHKCVCTPGVMHGGGLNEILEKIRNYDKFNEDDDPHGEHDFGYIYHNDEKIYWKFDYYDEEFEYFKEDGTRVLTIMLAEEY